jgi:hypothetical protein
MTSLETHQRVERGEILPQYGSRFLMRSHTESSACAAGRAGIAYLGCSEFGYSLRVRESRVARVR